MLIGLLLFGQLAIAAHACAVMASAVSPAALSMPTAVDGHPVPDSPRAVLASAGEPMPGCEQMQSTPVDPTSAKLCAEHCNYGQQSDQASPLSVPGVLLNALYVTPEVPDTATVPHFGTGVPGALASASPPHTILHCCFRL
jgi:hypothetical protein